MNSILACCVLLVATLVSVQGVCVDKRDDCTNFKKSHCPVSVFERWLRLWCPKTCGFCGPTIPTRAPPPTDRPTHGPSVTYPPLGSCGKAYFSHSRVIAGTTAKRGAWPWQILMKYNGRASCGGTIVSPTWVITAAHCVSGKERQFRNFKIRVGEHNRNSNDGFAVDMPVSKIITHPNWDRRNMNNDIALIKLAAPIKYNSYVQPACLPSGDVSPGTQCYITGWGKTSHPGSMVSLLQQAILPVVTNDVCERKNRKVIPIPITSAMICGGHGGATRKSGCHGDSGGPYVCNVGGRFEIHGAVSHGSPKCQASATYTVFARVTHFLGWINGNMAKYGI